MRVLITGCTTVQVGRKPRLGFVSAPELVASALTDMGHRVEHRPVIPGESLSGFHRVIVYLTPALALGSRFLYGALWALASHDHPIAAVDDWRLRMITTNARSAVRSDFVRLWESMAAQNRPLTQMVSARKNRDRIKLLQRTMKLVAIDLLPWPLAMLMFPWGNPELFPLQGTPLVPINPAPYYPDRTDHTRVCPKAPRWLIASTSDHWSWLQKQNHQWEVDYYGGTAMLRRKHGLKAVQEAELVRDIYPLYAGALCPPYPHAGAGWCRMRVAHAARNGVITAGSIEELGPIGGPFTYNITDIEFMISAMRKDVAQAQLECLMKWDMANKDKFKDELRVLLKAG